MDILIRQLGERDVSTYRKIRLEALKTYPSAYGTTYAEALECPLSTFIDNLNNGHMFGIICDDVLSGIALFMVSTGAQDSHIGHIYQMYIQSKHHGQGLGTKIFEAIITHARPLVKQIYLGVGTQNHAALALYKKAGFEIYGTEPRALCVEGQYIDEHLMVKFLDQEEKI